MYGFAIFAIIAVVFLAVIYGIFGVRILAHKRREARADRLVQSGAHGEAAALYAKGLKFNVGKSSGLRILEKTLDIYRRGGASEAELTRIKEEYIKLSEETNQAIAGVSQIKMKSDKKIKELERVSVEAGQKVEALLARLPKI